MGTELTDDAKAGIAELCGSLQEALKLAQAKEAECVQLHAENKVLLEKVANYEAQIKSASKAPIMPDETIDAVIGRDAPAGRLDQTRDPAPYGPGEYSHRPRPSTF